MIIWLTGQPGSGKTTIARKLQELKVVDFIVDGDELRDSMPNPGYDRAGRHVNIDRAQAIAAWLDDRVNNVAVALVAPYREQRDKFKAYRNVFEIYLTYNPDLELRGREQYWVDDYEPPAVPDMVIDTTSMTVNEAVAAIMEGVE